MAYRYKKIRLPDGGGVIDEHRYLMQEHLGRLLTADEIVHHKDENKLNNVIENLEVMSRADHLKLHRPAHDKRKWTHEERQAYSKMHSRERHPMSKVTPQIALEIKELIASGWKNVRIAERFGLSRCLISQIRHGHRWN